MFSLVTVSDLYLYISFSIYIHTHKTSCIFLHDDSMTVVLKKVVFAILERGCDNRVQGDQIFDVDTRVPRHILD